PLEVALNRVWGAPRNRNYFQNWAVAIGLAFGCGVLGMLSASFTALTETYSTRLYHYLSQWQLLSGHAVPLDVFAIAVVRAGAVPFTIAIFFFVYWRLPNVRVPVGRVLPSAYVSALILLTCADMAAPLRVAAGRQTAFAFDVPPPAGAESSSPPHGLAEGGNGATDAERAQAL